MPVARTYAQRVVRPGFQLRIDRLPGWAQRLVTVGERPGDSGEERTQKAVLVLSTVLMASLSTVWVVTYAILGLWVSAAIPFAYQVASVASLLTFARTKRLAMLRTSQLAMSLLLPFALQWSLGGFDNSSAVALWGVTSPLGALLFLGTRQSVPWFAAFAALVGFSAVIDPTPADGAPDIPSAVKTAFFALNILGVTGTAYALLQYYVRANERERQKSERLLLNVLPAPIATRLKELPANEVIADGHDDVTVLFADLVGFTGLSQRLEADELVRLLDRVFACWDRLVAERRVEKIKTIGDAYMVAAGIPIRRPDHAEAIASLALEMGPELERCAAESGVSLAARIGIDSGPVVAGVIGQAKFAYDLWGDPVNTASRMESHGRPGTIQVTDRVRRRLPRDFILEPRGTVEVKGKGRMSTWLLVGRSAP